MALKGHQGNLYVKPLGNAAILLDLTLTDNERSCLRSFIFQVVTKEYHASYGIYKYEIT